MIDILVIGGGASGMMAAITAARAGARVVVVEQLSKAGKKLAATGNGKCNFTNADMNASHFRGDGELFMSIYPEFNQRQTLAFFHDIGIFPYNKNGYYYPKSESAQTLVNALTAELGRLMVPIHCEEKVTSIRGNAKKGFRITTSKNQYQAKAIIIACGLMASPKLGSDGSMLEILKNMGHHFTSITPALCGLNCVGLNFAKVNGVRIQASVKALVNGTCFSEDRGELQLADYGISGFPCFQISRYISQGLAEHKKCQVIVDFLPSFTEEELTEELNFRTEQFANETAAWLFQGILPQKLIQPLLDQAGIRFETKLRKLGDKELRNLAHFVKNLVLDVKSARDFEFAQVCAGGIRSTEIHPTSLESELVPGLFFAGEILDVDGICGGYNLQWAWSSGYCAGRHAAGFLNEQFSY